MLCIVVRTLVLHVVKAKRMPNEPSADEGTPQTVTHETFRAWCRLCLKGRDLSSKHIVSEREHTALAVVFYHSE